MAGFVVLHTVSSFIFVFEAEYATAGNTNNATPSTYGVAELQVVFRAHGSMIPSISLSPETAHWICVALLPHPSAAGAVAVIEFVVSMTTAML
jgi:hypothetical protein